VNHGAVVAALAPNGPAANAGMKVGDIITSFNGKSISGPSDLGSAIHALKPGDHVTVEVTHQDGGTATLNVTLGTNPLPSTG
jgi:S1-C subfamily serine protease